MKLMFDFRVAISKGLEVKNGCVKVPGTNFYTLYKLYSTKDFGEICEVNANTWGEAYSYFIEFFKTHQIEYKEL